MDNADQRITQDANQVTILAGQLAFGNFQVNESVVFLLLQSTASVVFVGAKVRVSAAGVASVCPAVHM